MNQENLNAYKETIFNFVEQAYDHLPTCSLQGVIYYDKVYAEIMELPTLREVDPRVFDATATEALLCIALRQFEGQALAQEDEHVL